MTRCVPQPVSRPHRPDLTGGVASAGNCARSPRHRRRVQHGYLERRRPRRRVPTAVGGPAARLRARGPRGRWWERPTSWSARRWVG